MAKFKTSKAQRKATAERVARARKARTGMRRVEVWMPDALADHLAASGATRAGVVVDDAQGQGNETGYLVRIYEENTQDRTCKMEVIFKDSHRCVYECRFLTREKLELKQRQKGESPKEST